MEIMKSHQYIMSDTELAVSSFYHKNHLSPSIRVEEEYEKVISKLKAIHSHYTHLIEEMPDAVFVISKGIIVYANKAAQELLECEDAEFLGEPLALCFDRGRARKS